MSVLRIGFDCFDGEGPGIFLTRLRDALAARGAFDDQDPEVWIQLSYKPLPDRMIERRKAGQSRVIVRMDGAYCLRHTRIRFPVAVASWLDEAYSRRKNAQKNRLICDNLLAADGIVFQSHFGRALTQRFVTPTPPGCVIYNGVDLKRFSPAVRKPESPRLRVLMSHSFRWHHRLHQALAIIARWKQRHPDTPIELRVLGGGDPDVFAHARGVMASLHLTEGEDVSFLAKVPAEELSAQYQAADLMLNLSYWDTCPNVLIEALASGLPVVGTGYGGVGELLCDPALSAMSGGLSVPEAIPFEPLPHTDPVRMPGVDADRYVEAIAAVAAQPSVWANRARQRAEAAFDIERVAGQYLDYAARVCSPT